jgi:hypothetical protein
LYAAGLRRLAILLGGYVKGEMRMSAKLTANTGGYDVARMARRALADAARAANPRAHVDKKGYVGSLKENLVPGVKPDWFKSDLEQ